MDTVSKGMSVAPWTYYDWYFGELGHRRPRKICPRCKERFSGTFYEHKCVDYSKWQMPDRTM